MGKRTYICSCYIINYGLLYSLLVNIGVFLILFGLNIIFKNLRNLIKCLLSIIIGKILISIFFGVYFGYFNYDYDIKYNFTPYFILGFLLALYGIVLIIKNKFGIKIRIYNETQLEIGTILSLIGELISIILGVMPLFFPYLIIYNIIWQILYLIYPIIIVVSIIGVYFGLKHNEKVSILSLVAGIIAISISYTFYTIIRIFISPILLIGSLAIIGTISRTKFKKIGSIICISSVIIPIFFIYFFTYYSILLSFIIYIPILFILAGGVVSFVNSLSYSKSKIDKPL